MSLTGSLYLGSIPVTGHGTPLDPVDATTGTTLTPAYRSATLEDVGRACALAAEAAPAFRAADPEVRAVLLERIADQVEALGPALIERAVAESGLPEARITGEVARTTGQLRLFATEVRQGAWAGVRIDPALPDRVPAPRSDLRQRRIALGPVAVFCASNFPLAFSVAGGDTAAALAAGCPVVVKGHHAHLGTAELVASAIAAAVRDSGLHRGVFSLVFGRDEALGQALVTDPRIRAVGFTGSRAGGLALTRAAAGRPVPVPVYAEMSSVNPVFLLPGALEEDAEGLGRGFAASLTLGAGQFCTNPGLLVAVDGPGLDAFTQAADPAVAGAPAQTMLTDTVRCAYEKATARTAAAPGVRERATGAQAAHPRQARAHLYEIDAADFLHRPELAEEMFGAAALLVRCTDLAELHAVAVVLEGQLTVTLRHGGGDQDTLRALLPVLEDRAGRLLFTGWPTGVEVGHAIVHGGPYPATSDGRSTSVGTAAIERFLRPVCYQDAPPGLLPLELVDANPLGFPRRVDGVADRS
ncbi:aldehyde dehydrogenase (NADP(+)) [Streptomyces sp. ITFR-6]|uniref:aldehyde dehydrogenase (NADP(+)) n=1 Tax=Streptomyces sp. ITFR-6 TaxID=3075197 RepID=UPI002889A428|nr:aldehyde dehydrogenase (NADP(+)) [Streptomyces sp. ITFR-6]WNI34505.1 aldehyde dehydrogenase (NADP(+)) [Streptomyces sp. ITFR-6]